MFHNNNNELNQEEEEEDSITIMMMPLLVGCLVMTQEHEMAQLLAKKESLGGFCHTEELSPLTDSIRHNESLSFPSLESNQ